MEGLEKLWERQVFINGVSIMEITGNVRQTQNGEEDQWQGLVMVNFQGIRVYSNVSTFTTRQEAVDWSFGLLGTLFVASKAL